MKNKRSSQPIGNKFSTRLKNVLTSAQHITDRSGDHFIDTAHLLYGLAKEEGGIAREVLMGFKFTPEIAANFLMPKKDPARGDVPLPPVKKGGVATKPKDFDFKNLSEEAKSALEAAVRLIPTFPSCPQRRARLVAVPVLDPNAPPPLP